MKCEKCSSMTGFEYGDCVLCASCIDAMIYKCLNCSARISFNEKATGLCYKCFENCKVPQTSVMPLPPIECEICGKLSIENIGLSALCQKCADDCYECSHSNYEVIEELIDNYLHTIYLCHECGLRFKPD
jgi:hypothetical protein